MAAGPGPSGFSLLSSRMGDGVLGGGLVPPAVAASRPRAATSIGDRAAVPGLRAPRKERRETGMAVLLAARCGPILPDRLAHGEGKLYECSLARSAAAEIKVRESQVVPSSFASGGACVRAAAPGSSATGRASPTTGPAGFIASGASGGPGRPELDLLQQRLLPGPLGPSRAEAG